MLLWLSLAWWGGPIEDGKNSDSADDSGVQDTQGQDTQDTQDTEDTSDTGDTTDTAAECGIDNLQFRAEVRNGGTPCADNNCTQPFEVVGLVFNPCEEAIELPLTAGCLVNEWVVIQDNIPTPMNPSECNPNPSTMGIPPQQKREALMEWSSANPGQAKLVVKFNNPQQAGANLNFNIQ